MRKPLLALGLTLTLVVAGACGGDDDDVDAVSDDKNTEAESDLKALMLSSAEKAAENSSYRFEGRVGVPMGDQTVVMVMTGMADNSKPLMTMEMDMGAIPGVPAGDSKMSMILEGDVFYMKFPASMTAEMGMDLGGKSWAKIDLAALGEEGKQFEALLAQAKQADPAAYVALMTGATGDVTEVGTEEVRGEKTRHFKMTVDTAAVYENAAPELKEASKAFVDQYGNTKVPVEVWIGEDDLPRKISMTIDPSTMPDAQDLGGMGKITTTVEMFDYGVAVDVSPPPAEDTFDFAEILKDMPPEEQ